MAGNSTGAKQAVLTNKERHGENFFAEIGSLGGKKSSPTKGFGSNKDRAKTGGKLGGQRSFRGYKLIKKHNEVYTYENSTTGELMTVNYGSPFKTLKKVLTKIL